MIEIFPSIISSNILNLEHEIKSLEPYSSGFHLDVMDFHFVPNLTMGPDFINKIRHITNKQLQVHLMVEYPEKYLGLLNLYPNDLVSIHIEAKSNLSIEELFKILRDKKLIPSIAISPNTPVESIFTLITKLEHILLMTVRPGFSGQKFIPHMLDKLKALNNFKIAHKLNFKICVDGGITLENYKELIKSGANQLAIASAIFNSKNPINTLKTFSQI